MEIEKPELIIMIGIPGAGKTTERNKIIKENPDKNFKVISPDEFRFSILNYENSKMYFDIRFEDYIKQATMNLLGLLSYHRENIIIDSPNTTFEEILDISKALNFEELYEIDHHFIDCELETAIERNSKRDRQVPVEVIKQKDDEYNKLRFYFSYKRIQEQTDGMRLMEEF